MKESTLPRSGESPKSFIVSIVTVAVSIILPNLLSNVSCHCCQKSFELQLLYLIYLSKLEVSKGTIDVTNFIFSLVFHYSLQKRRQV